MNPLRILCLHGYHGNANVLREQMSALTRGLEHLAEFVYVDAPSLAQGDFGWWHAVSNEDSPAGDTGVGTAAKHYQGWAGTRDWIVTLFESDGPFDGVFGFSQGAALAALLVGLRSPDVTNVTEATEEIPLGGNPCGGKPAAQKPLVFNFIIVAGAFPANDPALASFYQAPASYDLPSVHIIGKSDSIVPAEYSREVSRLFKNPLVLEHGGRHAVAATPEIREQVYSFLQTQAQRRAAKSKDPP